MTSTVSREVAGILGTKLGMTQVWDENGRLVPVTVVEAGPCVVTQVRTVDRSERVRTYNYPENRISDHRSGFKAYNLDVVLDGELDPVVDSLIEMETTELLKGDSGE